MQRAGGQKCVCVLLKDNVVIKSGKGLTFCSTGCQFATGCSTPSVSGQITDEHFLIYLGNKSNNMQLIGISLYQREPLSVFFSLLLCPSSRSECLAVSEGKRRSEAETRPKCFSGWEPPFAVRPRPSLKAVILRFCSLLFLVQGKEKKKTAKQTGSVNELQQRALTVMVLCVCVFV